MAWPQRRTFAAEGRHDRAHAHALRHGGKDAQADEGRDEVRVHHRLRTEADGLLQVLLAARARAHTRPNKRPTASMVPRSKLER
jgi:hypothetical protein